MYTLVGFVVFVFSATIVLIALGTLLASKRFPGLRQAAGRMLVAFSVFAFAGAYVWLEAGPAADYRVWASDHPSIHRAPAPKEMDV